VYLSRNNPFHSNSPLSSFTIIFTVSERYRTFALLIGITHKEKKQTRESDGNKINKQNKGKNVTIKERMAK